MFCVVGFDVCGIWLDILVVVLIGVVICYAVFVYLFLSGWFETF